MIINHKYVDKLLRSKEIDNNDILDIMTLDNNEFLTYITKIKTSKQRILSSIYLNPAKIYECENISQDVFDKLIDFSIYRYTSNKNEIEYMLENGDISTSEYFKYISRLDSFYFPEDSFVGKNIKRIMESKGYTLNKRNQ